MWNKYVTQYMRGTYVWYNVSFPLEVEFEWAWVQATTGTAMGGGFLVLSPGP